MEDKLAIKTNAVALLERELHNRAKKNQYGIIVLSSATDPYLQFEHEYKLTRQILKVILKYRFPVHVITKSDLVTRDFDLLKEINEKAILPEDLQHRLTHKVFISFSFSTIDDTVGKIFEPGATAPSKRIETLNATLENGFYGGVSLMPLLPYITDTNEELEKMFQFFTQLGVNYIFPASTTLFGSEISDSKTLVFNAIKKYYPHFLDRYRDLFKNGFEPNAQYQNDFNKRVSSVANRFSVKTRIV
jgi:DNA repair photolyase